MYEIIGNDEKMKIDKTIVEIIEAKINADTQLFKLEGLWEYSDGSRRYGKMQVSSKLTDAENEYIINAPESNYSGKKIDRLWVFIDNGKLYRGNGCGVAINSARRI